MNEYVLHFHSLNTMFKLTTFCFFWLVPMIYPTETRRVGCSYGTEKAVAFADCSDLRLTNFPKDLKRSVEGLYLSWNFIKKLNNSTFEPYSSIKFLYLDQNPAIILESHTFAPLKSLNTLDLSYNPFLNISNLYLPTSLKKLYLSGLMTVATQLPISSLRDLNYLSLSECELSRLPSFGGNLPNLEALNVTENKLEAFKLDDLAVLCQLKKLYTSTNVSIKSKCECLRIRKWLNDHSIDGWNLICSSSTKNPEDCDLSPPDSVLSTYDSCRADFITKKVFYWFLIGCAVFVSIFLCIILYYCCNTKGLFCNVICCRCRKLR